MNPSFERWHFHETEERFENIVEIHWRIDPFVIFLQTFDIVSDIDRHIVVYALLKIKFIHIIGCSGRESKDKGMCENYPVKSSCKHLYTHYSENDPECAAN